MLTIVTWQWGGTFPSDHVNEHRAMIAAHLRQPHRYVTVTDALAGLTGETFPLWDDLDGLPNLNGPDQPSCYRRLKLFDPETTRAMGIADDDRVVSLDLDVVAVGDLDPLFDRPEDFVGWRVPGAAHSSVFNGTIWMSRAASMPHVWNSFDPRRSPAVARTRGFHGSDQGWLSYLLSDKSAGWSRRDGIISYRDDVALTRKLPGHARLISFHGLRKPWDADVRSADPWIEKHWRQNV